MVPCLESLAFYYAGRYSLLFDKLPVLFAFYHDIFGSIIKLIPFLSFLTWAYILYSNLGGHQELQFRRYPLVCLFVVVFCIDVVWVFWMLKFYLSHCYSVDEDSCIGLLNNSNDDDDDNDVNNNCCHLLREPTLWQMFNICCY